MVNGYIITLKLKRNGQQCNIDIPSSNIMPESKFENNMYLIDQYFKGSVSLFFGLLFRQLIFLSWLTISEPLKCFLCS